jgi:hypothetical protein
MRKITSSGTDYYRASRKRGAATTFFQAKPN